MDERFEILKKYSFCGKDMPSTGFTRTEYTDRIYAYSGNRLVKVLVGQRRVGKSSILRQLVLRLIEEGVDKKNVFFVNHELADSDFIRNYKDIDIQ